MFRFFNKTKDRSPWFFISLMLLIGLSEITYQLLRPNYMQALLMLLWVPSIFLIPVFLFKRHIKTYLLILLPIYLFIPLNVLYTLWFSSDVTSDLILLFLNTDLKESGELFHAYYHILIPVYVLFGIAWWFLYRNSPVAISSKTALYTSIAALIFFTASQFIDEKYVQMNYTYDDTIRTNLGHVYPISFVKGIKKYIEEKKLINDTRAQRQAFKYNVSADTAIKKQLIILVIGETNRHDRWAINGYTRNTSPKISVRQNLISFNNTVSGAYITQWAVPLILTGVGADKFNTHIYRQSIIGAFNEAGYNTYWISNQIGDDRNVAVHALEANHKFQIIKDKDADKDMDLLGHVKNAMDEPGDKKFIVLHTMGSHFSYSSRYPDSFDIFKPSHKTVNTDIKDIKHKNVLNNSYDNTILYTDAVLDSVISLAKSRNELASVIYISDHGENLLDDKRLFIYHIDGLPPTIYQMHVPFFIWYSPQLQEKYPQKIANLSLHKNAPLSSQNLIYTVTSLAGITYPTQLPTMDITSPLLKNNRQLLLGEGMNLYPYSVCK